MSGAGGIRGCGRKGRDGSASALGGLLITLGAVGLFLVVTVPVSLERQRLGLSDWAFDLAFFHSLIAHASAGEGFVQTASTHELNGLLGLSHAFWTLPLYVPLYRQFPRLETLLVLQALTLGLLGVALERLLERLAVGQPERVLLVMLLLSSPGVVRLAVSDFNPLYLALPLLVGLYWALERGRVVGLLVLALALACVREELPVFVGLLGLLSALEVHLLPRLAAWAGRSKGGFEAAPVSSPLEHPAGGETGRGGRARGAEGSSLLRVMGVVGVAAGVYGLQVWLRPRMGYYLPLDRPLLLLSGLELPPGPPLEQRLLALLSYCPAFSVLGLLASEVLLVGAPLLLWLTLRSPYEWWHLQGPYVHHPALLTGVAVLAGALGAARAFRWAGFLQAGWRPAERGRGWRRGLWGAGLILLVWQVDASGDLLLRVVGRQDPPPEQQARAAQAQAVWSMLEQIPPNAPVAADYRFIAWLSGRRTLYSYQSAFALESRQGGEGPPVPGLDGVDWVLLDEAHLEWRARLEEHPSWRRVVQGEGYALYRRRQ